MNTKLSAKVIVGLVVVVLVGVPACVKRGIRVGTELSLDKTAGENKYEQQAEKLYHEATKLLFQKGEEGKALLSEVVEEFAESPWAGQAQLRIAQSQIRERKTEEAKESYKKALLLFKNVINKFPDSEKAAQAMFGVASCYGRLNEGQKRIQALEQLTSTFPKSLWAAIAWYLRYEKKDPEKLEKAHAKVISICKELITTSTREKEINRARFLLADVYLSQKSWDKALASYGEIIKVSNNSNDRARAHWSKASLYKRFGELEKTKKECQQIIDNYGKSMYVNFAYFILGNAYYETGDYE